MSIPAAATIATTIFGYFSPTKSPFYAVITFSAFGLVLSKDVSVHFFAVSVPIILILLVSTVLSFKDQSNFTSDEYNNQIKFSRSLGISVAVLCLVFLGKEFTDDEGNSTHWSVWVGYVASVVQSLMYLLYIFIFHNYESRQRGVNIIQISLITSTYLVSATATSTMYADSDIIMSTILGTLYGLWALCTAFMFRYLARNFRLAKPADALPLKPGTDPRGTSG